MFWPKRATTLFREIFHKQKLEEELNAELETFQAMLIDRHLERGLSPAEARRLARLELEGMERVKQQVRDVRAGSPFDSLLQDLRYAWRTLAMSPGFAAVALLTLALGIGVNTAVFSIVYAVLLRPLPYGQPEKLAVIWSKYEKTAPSRAPASGPLLREIQQRNRTFQDVAGIWVANGTFTGGANPEQVKVAFVTPNFPALLGIRPTLGRVFIPSEEPMGGKPTIMLAHGLWLRRFGGDPAIAGKSVTCLGGAATVAGVLPPDFQLYFSADSNTTAQIGAMVPFQYNVYKAPATLYFLRVLARLKPGVGYDQAQADLDQVAGQIRGAYTQFAAENLGFQLVPLQHEAVREVRGALIALFAGAGFVLLICCVNVANLLLARANDRRKEIAVRSALGASQTRILRHLLLESLLLCGIAAVAGVALGWAGVRGLLAIRPDYLARIPDVGLNWPVLAFAAAISFASVLLFGLAPGLESAKIDLTQALRDVGRTALTSPRRAMRAAFIVAEVMLGVVLVTGAGLMIRTLAKIHDVDPGFEAQRLLTFEIDLSDYWGPAQLNFVKDWEARIAALPGVISVGATSHLPLDDYPNWYSPFRAEGVPQGAAPVLADHRAITPGYFRAMGTRLLAGRFFDEQDRAGARQVIIVDDVLARITWPGQSAIGKKIETEHFTGHGILPVWGEVVGVVEHVRNHSLSKVLRGEVYIPYEQSAREHLSFAVRTHVDPLALADAIRQELRSRNKDLAISKVRPMTSYIERATAPARFTAVLAGTFAGLALLLAAIGIYGVISYSVSRRMREMGVRMALGATSFDVMRLIMGEGLGLASAGILLGVAAALLVSRALQSLIYGISAADPLTYGVTIAVIALAATLGCLRPASKAASANPIDAIRAE